jgi:hypothetical protein
MKRIEVYDLVGSSAKRLIWAGEVADGTTRVVLPENIFDPTPPTTCKGFGDQPTLDRINALEADNKLARQELEAIWRALARLAKG